MRRIVLPELLDHLPESDPFAVRSRRDLSLINALMGNERWVRSQVGRLLKLDESIANVFELGAGDGSLITSMQRTYAGGSMGGSVDFHGVDLISKKPDVPELVKWHEGDLFEMKEELANCADLVVANLFLHHFEFESLAAIFEKFSKVRYWVINEPLRTPQTLMMSQLMNPVVNSVTEYDMDLSIRAGFQVGELGRFFSSSDWLVDESTDFRGACRLVARRK